MWLDPRVWQHYFSMLHASRLDREFVPTISILFRILIDAKANWLELVPSGVAIAWAAWYYARNRHVWDWRVHGLLLVLVTVLVSPYSWFSDEIVLLPALIYKFSLTQKRRYAGAILMAVNTGVLLLLLAAQIPFTSGAYLWTPAAWLAWYLWAGDPTRSDAALPIQQS